MEHVGFCINVTVVKMRAFVRIMLIYICKVFASSLQKLTDLSSKLAICSCAEYSVECF